MVVISFLFSPLTLNFYLALPVCTMTFSLSLAVKIYQLNVLFFTAVTKPIMQFLLALHIALITATVVFASPENAKPLAQDLNLHQATRWKVWPSSLRNLLKLDTRPNEEHHESHESQQFSFRSRISRRRHNRYHP